MDIARHFIAETRPQVGLMPTTAFQIAGKRIEPPVSVPIAAAQKRAAAATPEPEDDEPVHKSARHGLTGSVTSG